MICQYIYFKFLFSFTYFLFLMLKISLKLASSIMPFRNFLQKNKYNKSAANQYSFLYNFMGSDYFGEIRRFFTYKAKSDLNVSKTKRFVSVSIPLTAAKAKFEFLYQSSVRSLKFTTPIESITL